MAKAQREFTRPAPPPEPAPAEDDTLFGDAPIEAPLVDEPEPPPVETPVEPEAPPVEELVAPEPPPANSGESPQTPAGFKAFPIEPIPGRYGEPPYDHAPVQLTPDGERFMVAQWQVSRRWAGAEPGVAPRWALYGFWAIRATGGRPITFKPTGWREHRD
jgi:hypothetical protein